MRRPPAAPAALLLGVLASSALSETYGLACGRGHTCILTRTDTLLGCGDNAYGRLGLGESDDDVPSAQPVPLPAGAVAAQVACGSSHTCVLTTSGELLACGYNLFGQLGLGQGSAEGDKASADEVSQAHARLRSQQAFSLRSSREASKTTSARRRSA